MADTITRPGHAFIADPDNYVAYVVVPGEPEPARPHACSVCKMPESNRLHRADDVVVDGTTYGGETPADVVRLLSRYSGTDVRLVLEYGDQSTGRAWGDAETGRIGRSTGTNKIPLVVPNRASTGGPGILDHCIVRIRLARGKTVLWQHPGYTPA